MNWKLFSMCEVIVLSCLLLLCIYHIHNIDSQKREYYETACALSDIVRMHADCDSSFVLEISDYVESMDAFCFTIDSIDWHKYYWVY